MRSFAEVGHWGRMVRTWVVATAHRGLARNGKATSERNRERSPASAVLVSGHWCAPTGILRVASLPQDDSAGGRSDGADGLCASTGTRWFDAASSAQQLTALIEQLSYHAENQAASTMGARMATQANHARRRLLLRDHMDAIVAIGRASLAEAPQLATLRMPRMNRPSVHLKSAAIEMATSAKAHAALFVEAGLPPDFIERLEAAADAVEDATVGQKVLRARAGGATAGIQQSVVQGRRLVRILDALLRTAARDNLALQEEWESVKRVHRIARRRAVALPGATEIPLLGTPQVRLLTEGTSAPTESPVDTLIAERSPRH